MNSFAVLVALAFALVFVSAQESTEEVKADRPENPAFNGHQFQFRPNTEGRKVGLNKLRELMKKNLGLKPVQEENEENREKRGALLGHKQPVHQPVHQPIQPGCQPDYVVEYVEYCYYPQDYCY